MNRLTGREAPAFAMQPTGIFFVMSIAAQRSYSHAFVAMQRT
jgi:hypothetical protein